MKIAAILLAVVLVTTTLGCAGMSTRDQRILSGGALGAGAGAGVAYIVGAPIVVGVAAGAAAGAVGGLIVDEIDGRR